MNIKPVPPPEGIIVVKLELTANDLIALRTAAEVAQGATWWKHEPGQLEVLKQFVNETEYILDYP